MSVHLQPQISLIHKLIRSRRSISSHIGLARSTVWTNGAPMGQSSTFSTNGSIVSARPPKARNWGFVSPSPVRERAAASSIVLLSSLNFHFASTALSLSLSLCSRPSPFLPPPCLPCSLSHQSNICAYITCQNHFSFAIILLITSLVPAYCLTKLLENR